MAHRSEAKSALAKLPVKNRNQRYFDLKLRFALFA